jgi:predicted translin family RNA/ssDNA-binding protein
MTKVEKISRHLNRKLREREHSLDVYKTLYVSSQSFYHYYKIIKTKREIDCIKSSLSKCRKRYPHSKYIKL